MPNDYWLRKAEKEIRAAYPDREMIFEPLDCSTSLGVVVRIGEVRKAIRLQSADPVAQFKDWLATDRTA